MDQRGAPSICLFRLCHGPVFWRFVLPAQIVLPPIKKICSEIDSEKSYLSDCASSILFMWFEAFWNVDTCPYPKHTLPHLPLPQTYP